MPGDNRRPEHRVCRDPYYQEDWNHDRRNEIFHGLSPKENGIGGVAADRSQHDEEHCCPKSQTGKYDYRLNIFLALSIGLLPTRRRRLSDLW